MMRLETDVLVVGAGAAGFVTALNARKRRVCIVWPDSGDAPTTASDLAQGGIAAAVGAGDMPALHLADTLVAGCHQNFVPAARVICREAPAAISYLESLGVPFAHHGSAFSLHTEAAHRCPRVVHVGGDGTGSAIMYALRRRIAEATHVEILPCTRVVGLLSDGFTVSGVLAIRDGGLVFAIHARDVVIATGGIGGLYSRSTNPASACGDGPAMALAVGAHCAALEFVQFHPTALDADARPLPLISEALRGAGARLVDETGASIMRGLHPLGDLAPRDVVARAIYATQNGGGRVWLDATRLHDCDVMTAFPSAYRVCMANGINPERDVIPVTPAAHYHMGGIAVDLDGRASMEGLWGVGEAAYTGVHGANRLASNSLLEAVVFGRRAGRALCRTQRIAVQTDAQSSGFEPFDAQDDACMEHDIREVMWRCMGLVRNAEQLSKGLTMVARLRELMIPEAILQRSRLLLAERMMLAAARRRTSCGAHYRSDMESTAASVTMRRRHRAGQSESALIT
jgi:L-aspartate oxidase